MKERENPLLTAIGVIIGVVISIFIIIEIEETIKKNSQFGGEWIDKIGNSQILATVESISIIAGVVFLISKNENTKQN
ncbi:MAG: hypothetical protein AAF915_11845 [Cyanobacteria bacterium P01_D01_bin.50]